jgi:alpha-galactosidase
MSFKLAIIGAGSLVFTRNLFTDILSVPEFRDIEIAFTDINPDNLEKVTRLCQRDLEANGIATKIKATTDRREAFTNARYIINLVRVGGLPAFETDIDIPLKYGVDQCVGDTLCIGGIMYGQRVIAALLGFCKDIREVAEPGALLLNYSNPNAMATWACNTYGKVRTIGLCHGEIHGEHQIAEALGIPHGELDFVCAGLNHQTWYVSVKHRGQELCGKLLEGFENHPVLREQEKVRIDILRRFGYYSTESNGHLSEYVAWYRKRPDEIRTGSAWTAGSTAKPAGICASPARNATGSRPNTPRSWPAAQKIRRQPARTRALFLHSGGLETRRPYRGHFNVVNNGCITNLPDDCIVEVPCYVDGNGFLSRRSAIFGRLRSRLQPECLGAAPGRGSGCFRRCHRLKQAALLDPLTGAVCNPARGLADGRRDADRPGSLAAAVRPGHRRRKQTFAKGNLIPTNSGYRGAARRQDKTRRSRC